MRSTARPLLLLGALLLGALLSSAAHLVIPGSAEPAPTLQPPPKQHLDAIPAADVEIGRTPEVAGFDSPRQPCQEQQTAIEELQASLEREREDHGWTRRKLEELQADLADFLDPELSHPLLGWNRLKVLRVQRYFKELAPRAKDLAESANPAIQREKALQRLADIRRLLGEEESQRILPLLEKEAEKYHFRYFSHWRSKDYVPACLYQTLTVERRL